MLSRWTLPPEWSPVRYSRTFSQNISCDAERHCWTVPTGPVSNALLSPWRSKDDALRIWDARFWVASCKNHIPRRMWWVSSFCSQQEAGFACLHWSTAYSIALSMRTLRLCEHMEARPLLQERIMYWWAFGLECPITSIRLIIGGLFCLCGVTVQKDRCFNRYLELTRWIQSKKSRLKKTPQF